MESEYMNNYIKAIRLLTSGEQPCFDISDTLYKHGCYYLLSKLNCSNEYSNLLKAQTLLNKISIKERFKSCADIFKTLNNRGIPYAVIKGAVLSNSAYNDPFCRRSGDIDLLIDRKNIDEVKRIMLDNGFVQGRIGDNGIEPFTRKELLFQTSMSHQLAPFVKETNNKLCPYINVDINLNIIWGESKTKADMAFVLEHAVDADIFNISIKKLCPEMEFISLCLHHYKDMNSIYLLYERGLKLSHFCDIYFYIKNSCISLEKLNKVCAQLNISEYIYYCVYYTDLIFCDTKLNEYKKLLYSKKADNLIDKFGLEDQERQTWNIDFFSRLFETDIRNYMENNLDKSLLKKIKINQELM